MKVGDLIAMKIDVPLSKPFHLSEKIKGSIGQIIKIEWSSRGVPLFTVNIFGGHEPTISGLSSSALELVNESR